MTRHSKCWVAIWAAKDSNRSAERRCWLRPGMSPGSDRVLEEPQHPRVAELHRVRAFWDELLRIAALEVDAGEVERDTAEGRRQLVFSDRQRPFRRWVSLVQQGPHMELLRFEADGEESADYVGQPS